MQLEEDAVGRVAVRDAVGDIGALDPFPAADADADSGAAQVIASVQPPAIHRVNALDDAVLEVVAAKAGPCRVVDVEVAEGRANHELKIETFGVRIVLVELDPRAVDFEVEEHAVGEMIVTARAVMLRGKARERHRLVALEQEARRAFSRADERDSASPHRRLAGNAIDARRAVDHARPAVACAGAAKLVYQRRERRLVVRLSVTG